MSLIWQVFQCAFNKLSLLIWEQCSYAFCRNSWTPTPSTRTWDSRTIPVGDHNHDSERVSPLLYDNSPYHSQKENCMPVCLCVCMRARACACAMYQALPMWLSTCWSRFSPSGVNLGLPGWQKMPLPTKPSHWFLTSLWLLTSYCW